MPEPGEVALRVRRAGVLDLLVDAGRSGWQRFGMPPGGPADAEAFRLAGLLAGGPGAGAMAAIEVTASGPELEAVGAPCRVAVATAGEVGVLVLRAGAGDSVALPPRTSVTLGPGDRLRVGAVRGVLRAYIAVRGGVAVEPQLGSRSTCLRGGTTGILARALHAGDELPLGPDAGPQGAERSLPASPFAAGGDGPLALAAGPQAERLSSEAARSLFGPSAGFRAAAAVDRTGIRLEGPPIRLRGGHDVASQGCPPGALQLTTDGAGILLGPDRGTTGGYAIPAVVAGFDLPRLGRIRPGAAVRFHSLGGAEAAEEMTRMRAAAFDRRLEPLLASL